MKRKGEVEELVRRIVELEAELKKAVDMISWKDNVIRSERGATAYGYSLMRQAQRDNERLRGKLQRRSRELGIQRAEVKKIDGLMTDLAVRRVEDDQMINRLLQQVDVLWKLASVHFSADEIHKAYDDKVDA